MAERAVSIVLEKLSAPLIQEAALQLGVRGQVDWLMSEMRWMESFLKVADAKRRNGDELVKNWIREVRDVAHRAEDIIDIFMLEIEPRQRRQRRSGGLMGRIIRYAAFPFELIPRHSIGAGIQELRAKIEQIKSSRESYGLVNLGDHQTTTTGEASRSAADEALQARRRISPNYLDDDTVVVGLDAHLKVIMDQLLDANIARRCVISIVGPGGIGKTTLAKKLYNSSEIRTSFDAFACVSVSQDYRVGELLKSIAKQVLMGELKSMGVDELKEMLYKFLKERRYFIVLDDVWSRDAWLELAREVLPDAKKNGSRVLVTTRSIDIATSADPRILPYQLPFLNHKDSWELFLRTAFPEKQDDVEPLICPEELEGVGRELVKRCGGLPLALQVLGGLVSRKDPNPVAWTRVAERMDWASTHDGADCLKILGLSYDDLPHHHLRSCFLYLVVFPEDAVIYAHEMIHLWIAEGFIPRTSEARTVEDTAKTYLDELAQRSMIQVASIDMDRSVASCRVHDLLRDFCIREAKEDGFLSIYSTDSIDHDIVLNMHDRTLRRLALHNLITSVDVKDWCPPSNLRSLLAFRTVLNNSEVFNGLKLLRVIHLVGVIKGLTSFPEEMIKSMIHLRYLSLGIYPPFAELPSSIGNLRNLQTLDVVHTGIRRLPKSLGKIQTLRHLYLPYDCECPPNIGNLTNLHALISPSARGGWIEQKCLEKLVNIQMLAVCGLMATQEEVFFHSLRRLKRLTQLTLHKAAGLILTESFTFLSNHNQLRELYLEGPISHSSGFPPSLTSIELKGSKLEQDPMATLEKLPNLVNLTLSVGSYTGKEMVCTEGGGFPHLQYLCLDSLEGLEDWRVEGGGSMRQLRTLRIQHCSRLAMLPEGLQHVTSLKRLFVTDDRVEFKGRLEPDVGDDWHKIRHVPYIKVEQML